MASVQYYAAATLDGFIARPDGNLDWLLSYGAESNLGDGPMSDGSYDEFYAGIGALVMGSATYEWLLAHAGSWPYDLPTWVFSTRELPPPHDGEVKFTTADPTEVQAMAIEAAESRNLWMVGGGNLASQWAERGLIDELILTVVPVVIGEGLPLFAQAVDGELHHASTKAYPNGMVEHRYFMPKATSQ